MRKKMKNLIISDYVIDADKWSEATINGFVQEELDKRMGAGMLKFVYEKRTDGYKYTVGRTENYSVSGDVIMDRDCALLTGLWIENFQVNQANPAQRPLIMVVPYGNAYYAFIQDFEKMYQRLLGMGENCEAPSRVKVCACDSFVSVEVGY